MYAGKLCAALDRQHPRDLFDVHKLLQQEGISDLLWQAFLIYLSSSDRPIHEMIAPRCLDIRPEFFREFLDMSADPISISDLEQAREMLIQYVQKRLKTEGSDFLASLLQGDKGIRIGLCLKLFMPRNCRASNGSSLTSRK